MNDPAPMPNAPETFMAREISEVLACAAVRSGNRKQVPRKRSPSAKPNTPRYGASVSGRSARSLRPAAAEKRILRPGWAPASWARCRWCGSNHTMCSPLTKDGTSVR